MPVTFLEHLQLVRYKHGQFYKAHHDYLPLTPDVEHNGQRTITLFVYLNDLPADERGGGTHFPELRTTIKPSKGKAALWHNVRPDGSVDTRTLHSGESITGADTVKYGLNVWFRDRPQR